MIIRIWKDMLAMESKEFFLFFARMNFGFWLGYVGLMKWVNGASGVVGHISGGFADTWVPMALAVFLGWVIVIMEPVVGIWLLIGKCQRMAWITASKLMFLLTFGVTILGKHDTVANNWQFLILCIVCAALTPPCQSS